MRSLMSIQTGGPETLVLQTDVAVPTPGPGTVLIRVEAASLNLPDLLLIEDRYQMRPQRPFAPGSEVAGTIAAVGADVTGLDIGQRVMGITSFGGLADYALCPVAKLSPIPDAMPATDASALLVTYATAWHALDHRAGLRAGETLLVLGASGGVGLAAVELGVALGARVIAAASSQEKCAVARAAGATESVIYPRGPLDTDQQLALSRQIKSLAGDAGLGAIFDPVGGDLVEPAFRALGWEGRYLVIGFAAGIARLPMNLPLLKGADLRGVYWAEAIIRDPKGHQQAVRKLCDFYARGAIRPRIHATYPLERAVDGLQSLADRTATGKVVITL